MWQLFFRAEFQQISAGVCVITSLILIYLTSRETLHIFMILFHTQIFTQRIFFKNNTTNNTKIQLEWSFEYRSFL